MEELSLLTLLPLIYLIVSTNNLLPTRTRPVKKARTIKKVLGAKGVKGVAAIIGANTNIIKKRKKSHLPS